MIDSIDKLLSRNRDLLVRIRELEEDNRRLKRQIEEYVCEFRVCRFCKNLHKDCTPTGGDCTPKWCGL